MNYIDSSSISNKNNDEDDNSNNISTAITIITITACSPVVWIYKHSNGCMNGMMSTLYVSIYVYFRSSFPLLLFLPFYRHLHPTDVRIFVLFYFYTTLLYRCCCCWSWCWISIIVKCSIFYHNYHSILLPLVVTSFSIPICSPNFAFTLFYCRYWTQYPFHNEWI